MNCIVWKRYNKETAMIGGDFAMATKLNMYRFVNRDLQQVLGEVNDCVMMWDYQSGSKRIGAYRIDKANELRDKASNMQGKLQVLLHGLDKNSAERDKYEANLSEINMFMDVFKDEWEHRE